MHGCPNITVQAKTGYKQWTTGEFTLDSKGNPILRFDLSPNATSSTVMALKLDDYSLTDSHIVSAGSGLMINHIDVIIQHTLGLTVITHDTINDIPMYKEYASMNAGIIQIARRAAPPLVITDPPSFSLYRDIFEYRYDGNWLTEVNFNYIDRVSVEIIFDQ